MTILTGGRSLFMNFEVIASLCLAAIAFRQVTTASQAQRTRRLLGAHRDRIASLDRLAALFAPQALSGTELQGLSQTSAALDHALVGGTEQAWAIPTRRAMDRVGMFEISFGDCDL
jgi:hypothetical protein